MGNYGHRVCKKIIYSLFHTGKRFISTGILFNPPHYQLIW